MKPPANIIAKRMLRGTLFVFWGAAVLSSPRAESAPPDPYPVDRYETLWKKSPFTLVSAARESSAGFAENLALVGVIKDQDEYYVAVFDKISQKREFISQKPNDQGLKILRIEPSDDLTKVLVTLQKGDESSVLRYDAGFLKAAPKTEGTASPAAASFTPQPPSAGEPPPTSQPPKKKVIPSKRPPFPITPSTSSSPQTNRPERSLPAN